MKSFSRTVFVLTGLISLTAATAQAVDYNKIQPKQSQITFRYQQMGVAMDGKFKRFTSQLSFDPAQPAKAKASFDVELASIDTGSSEADSEVAGKPWFNTKAFPTAQFASTAVKALGGNRYEVAGKLTIKGHTQDVVIPATFSAQGKTGVFEGGFTLRRGDYSIGEGAWSKFDIVANDVNVKFRITATGK